MDQQKKVIDARRGQSGAPPLSYNVRLDMLAQDLINFREEIIEFTLNVNQRLARLEITMAALVELNGGVAAVQAVVDRQREERWKRQTAQMVVNTQKLVAGGYLVATDEVGPVSIVIGTQYLLNEQGEDVEVYNPRAQVAIPTQNDEVRTKFMGKRVGEDIVTVTDGGKIRLNITEIYNHTGKELVNHKETLAVASVGERGEG